MKPTYEGTNFKIWVGDCIEVMSSLPDESVNLIVTSPPYYAQKDYGNSPKNFENAPTFEDYLSLINRSLSEMFRLLCKGGRCCIVIDDKYTSIKTHGSNFNYGTHAHIIVSAQRLGFLYKGLIIWRKMRGAHASGGAKYVLGSFPYPPNIPIITMFEYILVFQKPGKYPVPEGERKEESKLDRSEFPLLAEGIWEIPAERERVGSCPSPFPIEIPKRLIRLFSFKGDVVLDPFLGSGTTVVASLMTGRIGWGIELNEKFAHESFLRIKELLNPNQPSLFTPDEEK